MRRPVLLAVCGGATVVAIGMACSSVGTGDTGPTPPAAAGPPNAALEGGHPLFTEVTSIAVYRAELRGTTGEPVQPTKEVLDAETLRRAVDCLEHTRELRDPPEEPHLDETGHVVLLEIVDRYGDRMFELRSADVLAGGKGRHFWTPCLLSIVAP